MHAIRFCFSAAALALVLITLHGRTVLTYNPMDAEIIMPSCPTDALTNRIEGSVLFRVVFNQQKVESIALVSSTLKMGKPPRRPSPAYQEPARVREVEERLQRTIAQWTTTIVSRMEREVEINLKADDSLQTGQRRFFVEYKDSMPARIELNGPGREWQKAIDSLPTTK